MKVKEMIKRLKTMPQNLDVGISAFDNAEWEIGDWATQVNHFVKSDCEAPDFEDAMWDDAPKECVVIRA